jgi:hypothetical protein
MKTLLNGNETALLSPDDPLTFTSSPSSIGETPYLSIGRPSRGWQIRLQDFRANHLSPNTTSATNDFLFLYWQKYDLLCFAGYKRFFSVSAETGQILISLDLEFTNKNSLDFLEFMHDSSLDKLLVVSTKLAWVIDGKSCEARKFSIPGLAETASLEQNGFKIGYIDTSKVNLPKRFLNI